MSWKVTKEDGCLLHGIASSNLNTSLSSKVLQSGAAVAVQKWVVLQF